MSFKSDDMNNFDHCGLVESSISYLFYILLKNTKKKSSDDGCRNFLIYANSVKSVAICLDSICFRFQISAALSGSQGPPDRGRVEKSGSTRVGDVCWYSRTGTGYWVKCRPFRHNCPDPCIFNTRVQPENSKLRSILERFREVKARNMSVRLYRRESFWTKNQLPPNRTKENVWTK